MRALLVPTLAALCACATPARPVRVLAPGTPVVGEEVAAFELERAGATRVEDLVPDLRRRAAALGADLVAVERVEARRELRHERVEYDCYAASAYRNARHYTRVEREAAVCARTRPVEVTVLRVAARALREPR